MRIFKASFSDWIKWVVFTLLMGVGIQNLYAQTEAELLKALETTPEKDHDSIYYEFARPILNEGGDYQDYQYAKRLLLHSMKLSYQFQNDYLYAKTHRALGITYHHVGEIDSAFHFYRKGIQFCIERKFDLLLVYTSNDLGRLFENVDVYDSALKYYQVSLEFARKLQIEEDIAFALNNIGLVFYYLNNYNEALQNLQAAVDIKRKSSLNSLHVSLMNIGLIYNDQGRHKEALTLLKEVEREFTSQCTDFQLADLNSIIGHAYYNTRDYNSSYFYFNRAYKEAIKSNNRAALSNSLYHFGLFRLKEGDYSESERYFNEALVIAEETNLRRTKRDLYSSLQELYSTKGDLEQVVSYQRKYLDLKDSIFNEQVASNILDFQLDVQQKQSNEIINQKEEQLSRSRLVIILIGVIALLLIIVSFLLFKRYQFQRKMKLILERQVQLRTADLILNNSELKLRNFEYQSLLQQTSKYVKGPLATLMGLVELAEKDNRDPERTQEYLEKIKKIAGSMGWSLEQLQEVARVGKVPQPK